MKKCLYCHKSAPSDHRKCDKEWERRLVKHLCFWCGKSEGRKRSNYCGKCTIGKYSGYENL